MFHLVRTNVRAHVKLNVKELTVRLIVNYHVLRNVNSAALVLVKTLMKDYVSRNVKLHVNINVNHH